MISTINDIELMLLIITMVTTWVDYIINFRIFKNALDFKPLNCSFCLSIWVSVFFVYLSVGGWLVLATPLFVRIIERRLL